MRIQHPAVNVLYGLIASIAFLCPASPAHAIAIKAEYVFEELFPKSMRDAFDFAANDILGPALHSSYTDETVDVLVRWRELGWPNSYAETRVNMFRDFESDNPSYQKDTYFPSALANHLAEKDFGARDITLTLNISSIIDGKVDWYFGTDAKAKPDQVDFVTLVLHELVHGLGLFPTVTGDGSFGLVNPLGPAIYDRFLTGILFDASGKPKQAMPLTDMPTDADRAKAIRWPELMWTGEHGKEAAAGDILFLYSPKDYGDAWSVGHADPSEKSLMNPFYSGPNHNLDAITRGMLRDVGWMFVPEPPMWMLLVAFAVAATMARRTGVRHEAESCVCRHTPLQRVPQS